MVSKKVIDTTDSMLMMYLVLFENIYYEKAIGYIFRKITLRTK